MLASVVVRLSSRNGSVEGVRGDQVHGWFLKECVGHQDAALAEALHREGRHKPFTVSLMSPVRTPFSPLIPPSGGGRMLEGEFHLRITSLTPRLTDLLVALTPERVGMVTLGDSTFDAVEVTTDYQRHPWAGTAEYARFWQRRASGAQPPGRVRLRFASPTAFESGHGNILFPVPSLVIESLGRKWNQHAPIKIPEEHLRELSDAVRPEEYQLQTDTVKFMGTLGKPFIEKGFIGWCEFSVGPQGSPETRRTLHLLADFAFFAGVGMKTTMGMGQTVAVTSPTGRRSPRMPVPQVSEE